MTACDRDWVADGPTCSQRIDALNAAVAEYRRLLEEERHQRRDLERLFCSGEIEAAKVIPLGVRGCRCDRCGCDPGDGFGFLVGWACEIPECPFGRPPMGVTIAEALGMRTEPPV